MIVQDGKLLRRPAVREFYNELRKRESGWPWYADNGTSLREIIDALRCLAEGAEPDGRVLRLCQDVGLVTDDFEPSPAGRSLLYPQSAIDRRHISFTGRVTDGR